MTEEMIKSLRVIEARLSNFKFVDDNLPDHLPPLPNITLTREHVERFRLSYEILMETLADIVGVDYHKLCVLDLLGYYYKKITPTNQGRENNAKR